MRIRTYLRELEASGRASEVAFYTPLVVHIFRHLLGYRAADCIINESGEMGIPDVRVLSHEDRSEWVVCEAKLHDADIRNERRRHRIWQEQIAGHHYITSETVYVVMCAPLTFRVYDVREQLVAGIDLDPDQSVFTDVRSGTTSPLHDQALREALHVISAAASLEAPQYHEFRAGALEGGYVPLSRDTVHLLQRVFTFGLEELRRYCKSYFLVLRSEFEEASPLLRQVAQQLEDAGTDPQLRSRLRNRQRYLRRRHRVALQLFEEDFPQFQHDQTYAGTATQSHFEDIFVTDAAYIALTRMFFVRICEDIGLTTRKVSNQGPGVWRSLVQHIKDEYKDLLSVAYRDAARVYSRLFEETVFDWSGEGNGVLNAILERILFRLNAFSFAQVDRDLLGAIYQYFRPKSERKRQGEYYTPEEVVDYILARTGITGDPQLMSKRMLDPACGSFTFGARLIPHLLAAGAHLTARRKVQLIKESVTGRDINPFPVFLSHLSLLFVMLDTYREAKAEDPAFTIDGFDVAAINSLLSPSAQADVMGPTVGEAASLHSHAYDYVVGNPPFVRNERLPDPDRSALAQAFPDLRAGNTDLASYFLDMAIRTWLREGGVVGMVAPIGQANAADAAELRRRLQHHTIEEIVSLEWMAKEVFPDADIIPMLLFVRKAPPQPQHRVKVVTGLASKKELADAGHEGDFRSAHVSELPYDAWLRISPSGDWPLDVTARDLPILQKLSAAPRLSPIGGHAEFGITLAASGQEIVTAAGEGTPTEAVSLMKGQHIAAYGVSAPEEVVDLSRISRARGRSIWRDLAFYRQNEGRRNQAGLGRDALHIGGLVADGEPSDTLVCLVPRIYPTLVAAVVDPLVVAAQDSSLVLVPRQCSAYVMAAIVNSRLCRYYSFLTMRAAILLRRRSTWYPRHLNALPWPTLTVEAAHELHTLGKEASDLSEAAQVTELDAYREGIAGVTEWLSAGAAGVYLEGDEKQIEAGDLAAAQITARGLVVRGSTLCGPDQDTLVVARMAALASTAEVFDQHALQGLLIPLAPADRAVIAARLREVEGQLNGIEARMAELSERIDEIVAACLGLSPAEHGVIISRCREFPLNVTVGQPRYVWSPDRKVQARRVYDEGRRFR